jgi:hypothetical protein
MMAVGTLGTWLHNRGFSRQTKNANIQKATDNSTENEGEIVQKHGIISILSS